MLRGDANDFSFCAALDATRRVVIIKGLAFVPVCFWCEPNADAKLDAMVRRLRDKNAFFAVLYAAIFTLFLRVYLRKFLCIPNLIQLGCRGPDFAGYEQLNEASEHDA